MAREPVAQDGEHEAEPGMVIMSFLVAPELKEKMGDAAWSTRMSRGALMRAFLAEADFLGWLARKTLKVKPVKLDG
jgi:hypothetical protein